MIGTSEYWILHDLPLSLLTIAIFALLMVGSAVGNALSRRRELKVEADDLSRTHEQNIAGALLGLLSLLLGFTFAMAIDRFDSRRSLVSDEANAISATYFLAQTFEDPHRIRISTILRDYVDNRIELASVNDLKSARPLLVTTGQLQDQLWREALIAVRDQRDDVSSSFLNEAVETIDVGSNRVVARQSHIPRRVMVVLLVYMTVTAIVMGFAFSGSSRSLANGLLFALLTMSIVLIIDLDRPTGGAITESQSAMKALQARLATIPPETFRVGPPGLTKPGGMGSQEQTIPASSPAAKPSGNSR